METADDVRLKKTCWWKHSVEEGCSVHVDTVWSLRGFYLPADFQASASKLRLTFFSVLIATIRYPLAR
jgi:hypothetical protein